MSNNRYYQLLNLQRPDNPTPENIKRAYKKMALKWHPDRNINNPRQAEEKFKEINQAYETLSNPEKKQIYDLYGEEGTKTHPNIFQNHNHNRFPFDFFQSMFRDNFQHDIQQPIKVTLEDLCQGVVKKYRITLGSHQELFHIPIKKGWKTGTRITHTRRNYQIQFIIQQLPHKHFQRTHNDLLWVAPINNHQAQKGVKLTLHTPMKNETLVIDTRDYLQGNIQNRCTIRIAGKGMPIKGGPRRGDLRIQFKIND